MALPDVSASLQTSYSNIAAAIEALSTKTVQSYEITMGAGATRRVTYQDLPELIDTLNRLGKTIQDLEVASGSVAAPTVFAGFARPC